MPPDNRLLVADHATGPAGPPTRFAWACGVSYDGTGFCGWQVQPQGGGPGRPRLPSVQASVQHALSALAGDGAGIGVRCAGRTDAGVHAVNQVIAFDTAACRPAQAWVRGTNARLPAGVAVRWAKPVPAGFDPRRHALSRSYRYLLRDEPVRAPLWRHRSGWTHRPLDADRMHAAAATLLGTHDFTSFRAAGCQARTPVRTMLGATVRRSGRFVVVDLEANAFLHHMVRNLVGALVMIGDGRRPPDWLTELLLARDRARAAPTFAPDGLYLNGVRYPDELALPSRAVAGGIESME